MPLDENRHRDQPHPRPAEEMTEEERARAWWSIANGEESGLGPREAGSTAPAHGATCSPS